MGWLPVLGSALAVGAGLVLAASSRRGDALAAPTLRVVEVVVPLVFGLQSAFLLPPDGEPSIELLLASPRPVVWALCERIMVMTAVLGSIAVVGSLCEGWIERMNGLARIARWLVPCVSLGGAALFTTQLTRQGTFGALMATLLWGGMLFGFDAVLTRWPFLWPLHVYLQPGAVASHVYTINRVVLSLIGLGLTALAAYLLGDEERVLGIRGVSR
jgi:hypothetical protein